MNFGSRSSRFRSTSRKISAVFSVSAFLFSAFIIFEPRSLSRSDISFIVFFAKGHPLLRRLLASFTLIPAYFFFRSRWSCDLNIPRRTRRRIGFVIGQLHGPRHGEQRVSHVV